MPRKKQGHSRESATGGYLKKKTDPGLILIPNESLKHFPVNNELVFKIKKTVSSNIPLSASNEKNDREHIEATKSLNDNNKVSQHEVNNNLIELTPIQDGNNNPQSSKSEVNFEKNGNKFLQSVKVSGSYSTSRVMNVSVNNSLSAVFPKHEQSSAPSPDKKSSVPKNDAYQSTLQVNNNWKPTSRSSAASPKPGEARSGRSKEETVEVQNQQLSEMSGTVAVSSSHSGIENKAETQASYRVSSSEKLSNGFKDAANPVLEQNCQLPSSVYGKSASSIENVLTGLQVPDKGKENDSQPFGKTSYLQEILEKKTQRGTYLSKSHSEVSICNDTVIQSDSKSAAHLAENKVQPKAESKLKLRIPDVPVNEDSNSLASAESQKSLKFNKITSPQNLEQHISKIISENAAIVDTIDPIWNRRYYKQTSLTGSDTESKKTERKVSRVSEEKSNSSHNSYETSNKSKLQSALLGGCEELNPQIFSPVPSLKEKSTSKYSNSLDAPLPSNAFSKSAFSVSEDELKGSAIKSLLSFKQSRNSKPKNSFDFDQDVYHQHPQNPERSIIKDLLLKSKSSEESKTKSEADEKLSSQFDSHSAFTEFSYKHNFEPHPHYNDSTSSLLSLRDSAEKFRFKDTSAQAKPLDDLNFQYKIRRQTWTAPNTHSSVDSDEGVGKILKKELLKTSSPNKRRKLTDSGASLLKDSYQCFKDITDYKAFPSNLTSDLELSPHRGRSQSVHLYGGEVQVLDGSKTKKIKIKTPISRAFPMFDKFSSSAAKKLKSDDSEMERDPNLAGVVVTIAQPAHNNGGTVHMSSRKPVPSISPVSYSSDISAPSAKYSKMEVASPAASLSKISQLSDRVNSSLEKAQNLSYPYDFFPGPDSKPTLQKLSVPFEMKALAVDSVMDIPPSSLKVTLSPGTKPFYSPIFSGSEKSFDLSVGDNPKEKNSTVQRVVPTVLFTPSSPTHPSTDDATATSEPVKKFLAPARPTSLPLKKKPFTMVSSTLVSPETPRPKKSCVQLYLNGHAYTYLGLKCSTRSTYCCIYRPQPMFVSQETNPKLSMYSNWQVMPSKEELSGLTPGQMISFYNSKQKRESKLLTTNSKVGEPLIFTHSSYWTYRSQDHSDEKSKSKPQSDASANQIEDSTPASEYIQVSVSENTRKESVISSVGIRPEKVILSASDSNSCLEPDNTVSEAEELNNSNEEDDDCQDDGTESLTDSSQPQPPKRVKICEGGFKSNEDYTYVRGRGRGKYVCEECGIRCKKPSMLKKHIRTHTDLRPYKCRHCSFAFKTKGNLTKHMKSKAHHKKCTELGIIPVPTTTDDSQIDEEALAKQIENKKNQISDGEDADDDDDEDSGDESEDECESDSSSMISSNQAKMLSNGHSKPTNSQEKPSTVSSEESVKAREPVSQHTLEQEVASSLLNLSSFGEPSQWSTSTGDLTDVTSSGETETGSVPLRSDQSLLSPSQFSSQSVAGVIASVARSKNMTEQWLSTETLGHRPRSYSADIPLSGGKESLSKYKLAKALNSENARTTPVEESSEFGIREQFSRRYSISVAREARRPRLLTPPDWVRTAHKWLQMGETDQPMDLSITRDLSKCKTMYDGGISDSLLGIVTQEESGSEASLASSLDPYGESYQLKSLPVLSPQVLAEYESGGDGTHAEPNLISSSEEQPSFGEAVASRPMFYVQDIPGAEPASSRREGESIEDPPSPDIADYAVNSPNSPSNLEDNPYYYPQENAAQSANPEEGSSSKIRAEFIVPNSSSSGSMEEGKCVCRICNKIFAKSSHLRLHVNIHYFERPFRCENCAVSFRTKGHLQKHKRSVSHYNKVNMNMTFGTPTVDNPRPFKCGDCKIAFRIHGHLAKHLRSKMHIMKLECLGKLPFGMYAEMERSGVSLNEIDTTDCNNSLESLQAMAQKLYQRDPRRMRWQENEQISDTGCVIPAAPAAASLIETILPTSEPLAASFDPSCSTISLPVSTLPSSIGLPVSSLPPSLTLPDSEEVKQELSEAEAFRMSSIYNDADSAISSLTQYIIPQPSTTATTIVTPVNASPEMTQRAEGNSEKDSASLHRSCTCHICGRLFKSAKFLQVHLYSDHLTWNSSLPNEASSSNTSVSSVSSSPELPCDLCGKQFPNQKALQQHLLSHAQPRPFVCELCDAGFTSSSSLVAHKATHQNNSFASTGTENQTAHMK